MLISWFVLRLATIALFISSCCFPLEAQLPGNDQAAKVREFLIDYLKDGYAAGDTATRYFAAFVDLKGEGKQQVIVYFTDQHSCGTGGCTTLILTPDRSSYKVVTSITIAWPPIRVLNTKTNGWNDLSVCVQGGGIEPGYAAMLSFNGETYPTNPTVPPARRLMGKPSGEVVVPRNVVGVLLYRSSESSR